jgi:hypothetical protein
LHEVAARSGEHSSSKRAGWGYWIALWLLRVLIAANIIIMIIFLFLVLWQVVLIYAAISSTGGVLDVFEVYQPVTFAPKSDNGCELEMLLMEHSFGESYGVPFVGKQYLE